MPGHLINYETLDGSFAPVCRQRLGYRLIEILEYAAESKRRGVGVLSRLEVGAGLTTLDALARRLQADSAPPEMPSSNPAPWPRMSSTRRKKLVELLGKVTVRLAEDAEGLTRLVEPCLGVFPGGGWTKERYHPTAYFLNAVYRGSDHSLQVLPILDRLFGGSADKLLQALLAYSRLEAQLIRLTGHYGYFDHVFTALLVGNGQHLALWATKPFEGRGLPLPIRTACNILRSWILNPDERPAATTSTSRIQFVVAAHDAFLGIARNDVNLINKGAAGLFQTWARAEIAVWDGRYLPFINIPAIAVLRTAKRIGLNPEVPDAEGCDPELVACPDPHEHAAPFSLYAGLDLMLSRTELEPATLLLAEAVARA